MCWIQHLRQNWLLFICLYIACSTSCKAKLVDVYMNIKCSWLLSTCGIQLSIYSMYLFHCRSTRTRKAYDTGSSSATEDAQKKFGNAKAISSDQYFGKNEMDVSIQFIGVFLEVFWTETLKVALKSVVYLLMDISFVNLIEIESFLQVGVWSNVFFPGVVCYLAIFIGEFLEVFWCDNLKVAFKSVFYLLMDIFTVYLFENSVSCKVGMWFRYCLLQCQGFCIFISLESNSFWWILWFSHSVLNISKVWIFNSQLLIPVVRKKLLIHILSRLHPITHSLNF